MKCSEFVRLTKRVGWTLVSKKGSHEKYTKNGIMVIIPNHGSKELDKRLEKTLRKQMGL